MDFADRVVDVEVCDLITAGQQVGHPGGQTGQQPGGDGVELLDVTVRERAQEGAQRRRRPHPGEQPVHRSVAEKVEVVDAVGTGEHPRDDAPGLGDRVR